MVFQELFTWGILLAIVVGGFLLPIWKILRRMGFEKERATLMVFAAVILPGLGIAVLLWIIAKADWPALNSTD